MARSSAAFGNGLALIWLDEVTCSGSESSIDACSSNGWGEHHYRSNINVRDKHESKNEEKLFLFILVRLSGGVVPYEGRVEVYHDGQWGTVCDDSWDNVDASVVCLQLGYSSSGTAMGSAEYGEGSGEIWLDDVSCDGSESGIENCGHGGWGQHNCRHAEDDGVRCNSGLFHFLIFPSL